ncbi:MAG: DNRLRE domain-containing protein, partial [Phycisphaerales bacterium]
MWDLVPVKFALLRFEELFDTETTPGPIPTGALITSATLTYVNNGDTGQDADLHEVLIDWTDTVTYNTFGGVAGAQTGDDYDSTVVAVAPDVPTQPIDVTSSLQEWSDDPSSNRGWVFVVAVDGGVGIHSSDIETVSQRPMLTVTYTPCVTASDCNDDNPCTIDTCNSGVCEYADDDAAPCDDGDLCTETDGCSSGVCSGTAVDCGMQFCNPSDGLCVDCVVDAHCSGGDVCNRDTNECEAAPGLPIVAGDSWRYFKGLSEPPASWNTVGFDDSSWTQGATGLGYDYYVETGGANGNGDYGPFIATELDDMSECATQPPCVPAGTGYVSVYLRRAFSVADPIRVTSLTMNMYADDGYVAYINGVEVARLRVAGTPPAYTTVASGGPTVSPPIEETLDLTGNIGDLVAGVNVLAVQVHNASLTSRDLLVIPQLSSTEEPPCDGPEDCDDGIACTDDSCSDGVCVGADNCTLPETCNMTTGVCETPPEWTAYNDLSWYTGQLETNITKITSPANEAGLPSSGELVEYATGSGTSITLTATGGDHLASIQGIEAASGDAFDIFNGIVSTLGVISYVNQPSPDGDLVLQLTGMNPNATYELVLHGDRNAYAWDRASVVTISDVDGFTNESSAATDNPTGTGGTLFDGPSDDSTRLPSLNPNGYVARFTDIEPGSDGDLTLTVSPGGLDNRGKYVSALMLREFAAECTVNQDCDDGNDCTDDVCDPLDLGADASGCVYTNNTASCEDGDLCSENDECAGGVCTPGSAVDCSPQLCNPADGGCVDCLADLDCGVGETCNLTTHVCELAPVQVTFQDDGSYTGTQDALLMGSEATETHGTLTDTCPGTASGPCDNFEWDGEDPAPFVNYGLVRFDNIVGAGAGLIPAGATVVSATLTIVAYDPSAAPPADVHAVLVDWDETTVTTNNFGGDAGVQVDEYGPDIGDGPIANGTAVIDITTAVQGWVDNPASNFGLIFVPNSPNGVVVRSSEYATVAERPLLTVEYEPCTDNADCDDGNFCTTDICNVGTCEYTNTNEGLPCDDGVDCTSGDSCASGVCSGVDNCSAGYVCNLGTGVCDALPNEPPDQPTNELPADTSIDIEANPQLCVDVTDPESDAMDVTFFGREATGVAGEDFTVIMLPDPQNYAANASYNYIYSAQTQWVVDNHASRNIVFVTGLGDMVNSAELTTQWDVADAAFDLLEDPVTTGLVDGIPYGMTVGNHDQYPAGVPSDADEGSTTTNYNAYFGRSRFASRGYFGDHYDFGDPTTYAENIDNHYELFSASGMDFIIFHLETEMGAGYAGVCPAGSTCRDVVQWADDLLTNTYPNHRAIIISHALLQPSGNPPAFMEHGQVLYDALKDNPNVFLMNCGHLDQANHRVDTFDIGGEPHTIFTLISDYQQRSNGGNGWLRMLTFSPQNDTIHVETYSPIVEGGRFINKPTSHADNLPNDACIRDCVDGGNELLLPYDMEAGLPFQLIGTVTGVTSGGQACVDWPGRKASTDYEWYVTIGDGAATTTGPRWTFTSDGACTQNSDCDDGLHCTGTETCDVGGTDTCVLGSDPCPGQICDEDTDTCVDCVTDNDCDDTDLCTTDTCDGGTCSNMAIDCSDGNDCTVDTCTGGVCDSTYSGLACCDADVDCDDSDPCTIDTCPDPLPGGSGDCSNAVDPLCCDHDDDCDDSDICTADACNTANVSALDFNGTSDYVTMGAAPGLGATTFTLESWFKWDGGGVTASTGTQGLLTAIPLVTKGRGEADGSNLDMNYFLGIQDGVLAADFEENPTGLNHAVCGSTAITTDVWHHAAVTYDGTCWAIYLDGNPETLGTACTSCTAGNCLTCPAATPRADSVQHFGLATAMTSGGSAAGFFPGLIDEVRVWDHARTPAEILADMNNEVSSGTGLLGRWGLNEGSGGTAGDSTVPAEDGTINGAAWELTDLPNLGTGTCVFAPIPDCCTDVGDCTDDGNLCTETVCNAANCEHVYNPSPGCCTNDTDCDDGDPCSSDVCDGTDSCVNTPGVLCCNDDNDCDDSDICTTDTCSVANRAALAFAGSPDYVGFGSADSVNNHGTTSFTVDGWFYARSAGEQYIGIFRQGRQTGYSQVALQFAASTPYNRVTASVEDSTGHQYDTPPHTINFDQWYHFAMVVDRSVQELRLYVDGVHVGTDDTDSDGVWNSVIDSEDEFVIGAARDGSGNLFHYFDGLIDEIRIWDYAWIDPSIDTVDFDAYMGKQITAAPGLLHRWGMNEESGPTISDSVGADDGTINGATWETVNLVDLGSDQCVFTPLDCSHLDDACNVGICNGSSGVCEAQTTNEGGACDDGDLCTENDVCSGGSCAGTSVDCSDGNDCTDDACGPGANSYAVSFNGTSQYIEYGNASTHTELGLSEFTLEAWIYWTGGTGDANSGNNGRVGYPIVAKGRGESDGNNRDANYFLVINSSTSMLAADFESYEAAVGGNNNYPVDGTTVVTQNEWHHVAATYDGSCWQLFLDGVPDGSACPGMTPRYDSIQRFSIATAMGSEEYSFGPAGYFGGVIDEVRVWSRALDPPEILANMYVDIEADPDLAGRWSLDEGNGTIANDSSGNENTGTLVDGPVWVASAPEVDLTGCQHTNVADGTGCVDDGDPCTLDECSSGVCDHPAGNDGATCDDSNECTTPDTCDSGVCDGVYDPMPACCEYDTDCDDSDPQTIDTCSGSPGSPGDCANAGCDSNDDCDDFNPCTDNVCNLGTGLCEYPTDPAVCDDGNECTGETCSLDTSQTAVSFNGSSQYIEFGTYDTHTELGLAQFTLEAWVYWTGGGTRAYSGTNGRYGYPIVTKGRGEADESVKDANYFFVINSESPDKGKLAADFESYEPKVDNNNNYPVDGNTVLTQNVWHHVAVSYDGTCWQLY